MKLRLSLSLAAAAIAALPAAPAFAAAAEWAPGKPVRYIVGFPPGGATDLVARAMGPTFGKALGQNVVIDNRPGANGVISLEILSRADPDGLTVGIGHIGALIISPTIQKVPYDPFKSFIPIAKIGNSPSALVVHPSVQANTVKEFIALAKKQPGKLVAAAAGGGSFIHLSTELFKTMADIDFKIVQFKGGGPAVIDLIGGHSQFFLGSIQQSLPHIQSGKLRALGYGGASRSKLLPDLPTISEAGVPGYQSFIWWGLFAPAGTPQAIVDTLNRELEAIMKTPEMVKTFETQGAEQDLLGPATFVKFMEAESAKWGKVIKQGHIKLE